jgi:hypothetical protein
VSNIIGVLESYQLKKKKKKERKKENQMQRKWPITKDNSPALLAYSSSGLK